MGIGVDLRNTLHCAASISTATWSPTANTLRRMGLHPKHLAGRQRRIIFADVAEERASLIVARAPPLPASSARARRMFSGPDRDLDVVAGAEPVGQRDIELRSPAASMRAAAVRGARTLPGTRFTSPMKSATMRFAGRA